MTEKPFILGVDYWPQKTAMFMWREFDRTSTREDMSIISELGFSCVRIFILWEDFQPGPKNVPPVMLDRLVNVLGMAADKGLAVIPTLFTGYMSGLIWLPPWMLLASTADGHFQVFSQNKVRSNKPRNPFSEPEIMEAQIFFLRELVNAVSGHPALLAWNLGNRPSFWAVPSDEFSAKLWVQAMTETLQEKDDEVPVTMGFRVTDLLENRGLLLRVVAQHLDYVCFQSNISRSENSLDRAFLPFMGSITEWLAKKPVLVLDVGAPTIPTVQDGVSRIIRNEGRPTLMSEDEVAEFTEETLAHLIRFKRLGAFWQSYADYHPSIWSRPPLDSNVDERFRGILRHDRTVKPAAAAFKSAVIELPETELSTEWLDMTEEDFYKNAKSSLSRLGRRFREFYSFG
ncbi:MAG: hypothetical protein PVF76_17220 [Syntrophobacterales bacterium]|jgi:hypothetical protein